MELEKPIAEHGRQKTDYRTYTGNNSLGGHVAGSANDIPLSRPTVSKATLGKLLRDGVVRIWASPSAQIPS